MYINAKNPELTRNIWLELSTGRLIVMPLILLMIYFAVFSFSNSIDSSMNTARIISILIYMLLAILYGTKLATESIIGEMNDKTWDNQRLTLIKPQAMITGKLFGSTIFAWYGALLSIFVYFVTCFFADNIWVHLKFGLWLVLFSILTHETAMMASLLGVRKNRERLRLNWFFYYLVAVGVSYYIQGVIYIIFLSDSIFSQAGIFNLNTISWYYINISFFDFLILSTGVFILWAFAGLKNLLKSEFHFRNSASLWILFLVFLTFYFFGFGISFGSNVFAKEIFGKFESAGFYAGVFLGFLAAYMIIQGFIYYLMFSEKNSIIQISKLLGLAKSRNFKEFGYESPLWLIALIFISVVMILMQLSSFMFFGALSSGGYNEVINVLWVMTPVNLFLYLMRDMFILLFFNMNFSFRKPEIGALITYFILYYILPVIVFFSISDNANAYFSPFGTGIESIISILIQLILVVALFYGQFKRSSRNLLITE